MPRLRRAPRWMLLLAMILIWMALSACSCGARLADVREGIDTMRTATAEADTPATPTKIKSTATPIPTKAATATLAVPTAAVSGQGQVNPLTKPEAEDKHVDVTFTEAEINEMLAGQSMDQQGVEIEDVVVRITADEIIADLRATYAEAGISAGVQARGVPVVHNDDLYVQVTSFELDDTVSGLMRLVADQLIKQALDQYSTEYGIYVPQEEIVFESVELGPQQIHVTGEMR